MLSIRDPSIGPTHRYPRFRVSFSRRERAADQTGSIGRTVTAAYAEGRLRAPSRPGINCMLSTENRVPVDSEGTRIVPYGPHLMFYVPYLTNADLGSDGSPGSALFVIKEGQPGAYALVPVPSASEAHESH